jgi:hypothetical protein
MKIYAGSREKGHTIVLVDGKHLRRRLDLWSHSPDGFEWGYGGSGPAQLALAILADCLGDDERAVALHQPFKWAVVTAFRYEGWALTAAQVMEAVLKIEKEREQKQCADSPK